MTANLFSGKFKA